MSSPYTEASTMTEIAADNPITPDAPSAQGRRSAEVAERTKLVIVEAALAAFADHGFEGASLRDIAQRAGVTHGLIRHHFGNKEAIFRAVVDYSVGVYEASYAEIHHLVQEGAHLEDPVAVLKRNVRTFAAVSARHPEMMRLLMHEGAHPSERIDYFHQRISNFDSFYDELFNRAQETGALKQFNCDSYFLFLISTCGIPFGLTAVSSLYVGGNILDQAQIDAHTERIVATLFPD